MMNVMISVELEDTCQPQLNMWAFLSISEIRRATSKLDDPPEPENIISPITVSDIASANSLISSL